MPGFESTGTGDWICRLVPGAPSSLNKGVIEVTAEVSGKPYIARILGRDTDYKWKREFLKAAREYPSRLVNPAPVVRLWLPILGIGLPAALEIRWGPATGAWYIDKKDNRTGRFCAYREFFILSLVGFKQVQEQHVAMLVDDGLVIGPPHRPPGERARIDFSEEV